MSREQRANTSRQRLVTASPMAHPGNRGDHARPGGQVVIPRWRIYALLTVCWFAAFVLGVRLFDLQVIQHADLASRARNEIQRQIVLQPDRGVITDSRGNVLAMDVERQSLWVNPAQIAAEKAPGLALTLATLVNQDMEQVLHTLTRQDVVWVPVSRWLEPSVAQQVMAMDEDGLYLVYEPRRVYPLNEFAAHVVGAVNYNGDGILGVEGFYNASLRGTPGTLHAEFDSGHNPIAIAPRQNTPPRDGVNLKLTIDPLVQYVAETELREAVQHHDAEGGSIIVLEPSTGAVRGMATWPVFDPNHYPEYPVEVYSRNAAVSGLYEPGSTFKIITAAAGLQSRSFTADTQVHDIGVIDRAGMRIHNWNYAGNGMITVGDMLYYSSNVGAVLLNELIGTETFYGFLEDFGFGAPTGVDLSGEEQGIVHNMSSPTFNEAIFVSNSYGQGIAMTPLQLVRAVAAVANDGVLMKPYVVAERCYGPTSLPEPEVQQVAQGDQVDGPMDQVEDRQAEARFATSSGEDQREGQTCVATPPMTVRQVIEPGVAWTIRRMLVNAANHYAPVVWGPKTGNWADQWLVPGYEVGAKTGTASIPLPGGGYDPRYVIGSVVGFAPAENTRYAVLVKIDRPEGDAWGLDAAIPAFYEVVSQLMRYERLEPDPALVSPGQSYE